MTQSARDAIYQALSSIRLIDPHTHINPHNPASNTLADLLGYHYYTELAHSAGMPKSEIEEPGITSRELVRRLVENLSPLDNTAQYGWLISICQNHFGLEQERLDGSNWESVYDTAEEKMGAADWSHSVLEQSNVEAVFLTNDFDDALTGFDTDTYIPCLRTDDLVFHLAKPEIRGRLEECSGISLDTGLDGLREALDQRFEHFVDHGARACAISLPPDFTPLPVSDGRAATALDQILSKGQLADISHRQALARRVFWMLAERCDQFELPFDLMIGVNRGVYTEGVFQGQDLYDSRVSLTQYRELFNAFPNVKFPVSVLASVTNQELVSHAWIFPNVITNGHWWYSNTPSFIARDAQARLEAIPKTKQIGYYSDAYKLEFVHPKFDMYRKVLTDILLDHFVIQCRWSEERAIDLGYQVLRGNVDAIFPNRNPTPTGIHEGSDASVDLPSPSVLIPPATAVAGGVAATAGFFAESPDTELQETEGNVGETVVIDETIDLDAIETDSEYEIQPAMESVTNDVPELTEEVDNAVTATEEEINVVIEEEESPLSEVQASETQANDIGLGAMGAVAALAAGAIGMVEIDSDESVEADDDTSNDSLIEIAESDESAPITLEESFDEEQLDLSIDPTPSNDEIESTGASDVQLSDFSGDVGAIDSEAIEDAVDSEPLDVGDVLSEDPVSDDELLDIEMDPVIQPLRGEETFAADADSLRLVPDPVTGELTFPSQPTDAPEFDTRVEPIDVEEGIAPDPTPTLSQESDLDERSLFEEIPSLEELPEAVAPELQEQLDEAIDIDTDDDGIDGGDLLADFFEDLDNSNE